jgi:sulfur relay protein TusB/DsrH
VIKISKKTNLVYLFGFSPRQGTQLENLIEILKEQTGLGSEVSVVLLHDGVIGASKKARMPSSLKALLNLSIQVYAMIPDIKARGFDPKDFNERINCIEYDELADLLVTTPKIASYL